MAGKVHKGPEPMETNNAIPLKKSPEITSKVEIKALPAEIDNLASEETHPVGKGEPPPQPETSFDLDQWLDQQLQESLKNHEELALTVKSVSESSEATWRKILEDEGVLDEWLTIVEDEGVFNEWLTNVQEEVLKRKARRVQEEVL